MPHNTFFDPDLVFIDLEQTIIGVFGDPELCNVDKIHKFLRSHRVHTVHIFSFAIWSENDQLVFTKSIQPMIERALEVKVGHHPSVQDMMRADQEHTGVRFDPQWEVSEYIQLRGKPQGFINYINAKHKYHCAVLIDDVVPNMTVRYDDTASTIHLLNVDTSKLLNHD